MELDFAGTTGSNGQPALQHVVYMLTPNFCCGHAVAEPMGQWSWIVSRALLERHLNTLPDGSALCNGIKYKSSADFVRKAQPQKTRDVVRCSIRPSVKPLFLPLYTLGVSSLVDVLLQRCSWRNTVIRDVLGASNAETMALWCHTILGRTMYARSCCTLLYR